MTYYTPQHPYPLEVSESRRFVVYLVEWERYGGTATGRAIFSRRDVAVCWAQDSAHGAIDWALWHTAPELYPEDPNRDNPELNPTFIATAIGDSFRVRIWKQEVADHVDGT